MDSSILRRLYIVAITSVAPLLPGCSNPGEVCADVGLSRTLPAESTIAVGQSLTLRHQEGGTCYPINPRESDYHDVMVFWSTIDTSVVQVDSPTGRVTGRTIGDARVDGRIVDGGMAWAVVHVR
jgi:hypothetical protein